MKHLTRVKDALANGASTYREIGIYTGLSEKQAGKLLRDYDLFDRYLANKRQGVTFIPPKKRQIVQIKSRVDMVIEFMQSRPYFVSAEEVAKGVGITKQQAIGAMNNAAKRVNVTKKTDPFAMKMEANEYNFTHEEKLWRLAIYGQPLEQAA